MRKLRLHPGDVTVESFETTTLADARATVHAAEVTLAACETDTGGACETCGTGACETCDVSCYATACPYTVCQPSCGHTCWSTCVCTQAPTCGETCPENCD